MTSTVLDVTVLLLCVSASVVALGATGGGVGSGGMTAADAADRIATETVTVTYDAPESTADTQTVHATRAELLAMLVDTTEPGAGDGEATAAFGSRARSAIIEGLGPRTRLDVLTIGAPNGANSTGTSASEGAGRVELFDGQRSDESGASSAADEAVDYDGADDPDDTDGADGRTDVSRAVGSTGTGGETGGPWKLSSDTETPSWPTTATGRSWGAELRPALATGETRESGTVDDEYDDATEDEARQTELGLGGSPPRNADTTTAVLTHPIPSGSGSVEAMRVVVRRW
ncbi:DUF7284 family protein [Halorubrum sp. DTA46]|uniref:DUF7284 family protein n=1 Tax=Halorubrum sp. DTA46 TaxID=3402162 RepID=UPI003AAB5638